MPRGRMFDFISMVWVTFVIKLRNFDFETHWNTVIYLDKKMMSSLITSCQTVSNRNYPFLFELNFGSELRNTNFKFY